MAFPSKGVKELGICCNPMDYTVHRILQARILKLAWPVPSPADLPDPGIEPGSPALQVDSLPTELPGKPLDRQGKIFQREQRL